MFMKEKKLGKLSNEKFGFKQWGLVSEANFTLASLGPHSNLIFANETQKMV